MTGLQWTPLDGGSELSSGQDWVYLITRDAGRLVLTRWEPEPNQLGWEVARQAALHAIQLGGAWDVVPETTVAIIAHMKDMAQQYESGLDVIGQPAWAHGYQAARP